MDSDADSSKNELEEIDPVLELAICYKLHRTYPPGLIKERKERWENVLQLSTVTMERFCWSERDARSKSWLLLRTSVESCSPVTLITPLATLVVWKRGEESLKDFIGRECPSMWRSWYLQNTISVLNTSLCVACTQLPCWLVLRATFHVFL